jgi:DNA-binding FrmR family transcriptional regulator
MASESKHHDEGCHVPRSEDVADTGDVMNVDDRNAVAVDPDVKSRNLKRLRRIEGQIRGLHKMVDEERYCADILIQISSAQEALRAVTRELLRNHLKHCATAAIRSTPEAADAMYDELSELFARYSR